MKQKVGGSQSIQYFKEQIQITVTVSFIEQCSVIINDSTLPNLIFRCDSHCQT